MSESSCNRFYSHLDPNISLKDHLAGVGRLCREYAKRAGVGEKVVECAELMGKCHDLAKYTTYFQEYLRGKRVPGDLYKHSRLSAILASWIINKKLNDDLLPLFAFMCIDSHHGNLKSLSKVKDIIRTMDSPVLMKQVDSIKKNLHIISRELDELGLSKVCDFIENFNAYMPEIKNILDRAAVKLEFDIKLKHDDHQDWHYYYTPLLLFSCLVDADKKDAGRVSQIDFSWHKDLNAYIVTQYINENLRGENFSEINRIRDMISTTTRNRLDETLKRNEIPRIMSITAPTGGGKTLLGLYIALRLKEKLRDKRPKVIYCLPYINIIEQTYEVFKDIFSKSYGACPLELLLKHHHLFFPTIESARSELPLDKMLLLTESWESEVVVTTFEQLFRSIIGSRNASLKKFHNIANSTLILDEVQAIPLEYWRVVKEALENLAKNLNVKILMMTATMPILLRSGEELVPNHESIFRKLNRTKLIPHVEEKVNTDEFVDFFFSKWMENCSVLLVLNTVRTSKMVYRKIADRLGDRAYRMGRDDSKKPVRNKVVLAYLSTSVIPMERKARIDALKDLLKKGYPVILVSTQVVEAGVDLDFDMAFRDLAPLDSIVQVAGRCNRNWRRNLGEVHVLRIIDDRGQEDSKKIYGTVLPGISLEVLKNTREIPEKEMRALVERYFEEAVYRAGAERSDESEEVLENVRSLNYGKLDFSLIKEEPKIPVYIEYDDRAEKLLDEFRVAVRALKEEKNLNEYLKYRAVLRKIRAEMENYTVEVYQNEEKLKDLKPIIENVDVRYVPKDVLEAYYDDETGFKSGWEDAGEMAII
ncbi:MAG: CRISPR-associated helicase Cas3' [Thaumarchaeota archaeon]|nr:CRISPR-associated helicase Cas3' [Nitrososphaerota archaeon]